MKPSPTSIKSSDGRVSILWSDQHASEYSARDLRLGCRCAGCIDEWTHQSLIKPDLVPQHVKPKGIQVMGQYAVHIEWSDGHQTGIYTYDYLREICACQACKAKRTFTV